MKNWLLKPFPFTHSYKQAIIISLLAGVFVTLFLYIFKPFGINEKPSALYYLTGYGIIAFLVTFSFMQVLPLLLPGWFKHSKWNIWKNIIFMIGILFLISILNWVYGIILFNIPDSSYAEMHEKPINLFPFIGMTFSVGIFPILMMTFFLERQFFKQNIKLAKEVENTMDNTPSVPIKYITFKIPVHGNKSIIISSQSLIAVKAEGGNYVTVFWLEEGELKKQLWRMTLKGLLSKIESDQNILQCHKSYLVNRLYIAEVTGNARTLALRLKKLDFEIPVSRNFPRELVEHYHLKQA